MNGAGFLIAVNLDTEHSVELLKACDLYVPAHSSFERVHKTRSAPGDGAIIDMHATTKFSGFLT
jgi:hypothetical protein